MKKVFKSWSSFNTSKQIPKCEKEYVIIMLDSIHDYSLRNKLSNLIIWYINEAEKNKRWYYVLNIVIFISDGLIPVVAILKEYEGMAIITAILASLAAMALAMNNLFHFKDNWVRCRRAVENIKNSLSMYLIQMEDCDCMGDKNCCGHCQYCNYTWKDPKNTQGMAAMGTYKINLKCGLIVKLIEEINSIVKIENEIWYNDNLKNKQEK